MLQKLKITLTLFSFFLILAVTGSVSPVSADDLTVEFACSDNTTGISFTSGSNHEQVVKCRSGAKIIYENYDGHPVLAVKATCPTGETVGTDVDTPNQPTSKYVFYCEILQGHDDPIHTKTDHAPKLQQTTAPDACASNDPSCVPVTPDPAATSGNCATATKCDLVEKYINPLINFLAALVGVLVTIGIVWGGIEYSSSNGDPQKVAIARNRIKNSIIALVTFFFLWSMLNFLIPGGLF